VIAADRNPENLEMLMSIKFFFGNIGFITTFKEMYAYNIVGLRNGLKIKEHFKNFPLMTYKLVYFILWSKVLDIIQTGDHLNDDGFLQIMAIKSAFKEGLNSNLSDLYPEIKPLISPSYSPSLNLINEERYQDLSILTDSLV
jgi:LAGLIDADG endonuclease